MNEDAPTRAKILGDLIRDARVRAGRSVEDCGRSIGLTPEGFTAIEQGESDLSLPELEVLAIYLNVPMSYFWGQTVHEEDKRIDFASYVDLRHRIIGTLIRQARLEADLSAEALAERAGLEVSQVEKFESGEEPIPYFLLENLAGALGVSTGYFSENDHGPLARHEDEHRIQRHFDELPPHMRAFVAKPTNISYLETAMRLSEMDVDRLRGIAESILDITL